MDGKHQILLGDIMVTRNPCLHPGDIRVLTAVDRPEFSHLYNVVVFSSKGKRPMCNMMAGGDLDGDVYFVCWDETLLGKHLKKDMVCEPAKYEKPKILTEKPDGDSLADYFVFYLERDVLGKIANLHLALSDYYGRDGPLHDDCIYLSHLASVAVDFAKHGECVHVDSFK
jgi:RNA-dependent RNA polymerase